jgi:hypothetical protein
MRKPIGFTNVTRNSAGNEKVCTGRDLAEALGKIELPEDEPAAWRRDLTDAGKTLMAPVDPWRPLNLPQ